MLAMHIIALVTRLHDAGFAVGAVMEAVVVLVVEGGDEVAVAVVDDGAVDEG